MEMYLIGDYVFKTVGLQCLVGDYVLERLRERMKQYLIGDYSLGE
jgi:hypothetical protein